MNEAILQVRRLQVRFGARTAVRDVSFDLFDGESLGLVGESGSGKSTLARAILRLVRAANGSVMWRGQDLLACDTTSLRRLRRDLQIVFQDPLASLSPRMTAREIIAEPLRIFEASLNAGQIQRRVDSMLERVGLTSALGGRLPHEFSGGQCQRIGIARAMVITPQCLICDEPVSSLDVSIQGQIVNLLLDLQRDAQTAMLFISHNLAIVRHVCHRVMVMYAGLLVEVAPRDALFATPIHPYTVALVAAVPALMPHPRAATSRMPAPSPFVESAGLGAGQGCAYRGRCVHAVAVCGTTVPPLEEAAPGHWVACHRAKEFPLSLPA